MPPESDDPRLTSYALGELDGPEAAEVETRLAADPEARAFVREVRDLASILADEFRSETEAGLERLRRASTIPIGPIGHPDPTVDPLPALDAVAASPPAIPMTGRPRATTWLMAGVAATALVAVVLAVRPTPRRRVVEIARVVHPEGDVRVRPPETGATTPPALAPAPASAPAPAPAPASSPEPPGRQEIPAVQHLSKSKSTTGPPVAEPKQAPRYRVAGGGRPSGPAPVGLSEAKAASERIASVEADAEAAAVRDDARPAKSNELGRTNRPAAPRSPGPPAAEKPDQSAAEPDAMMPPAADPTPRVGKESEAPQGASRSQFGMMAGAPGMGGMGGGIGPDRGPGGFVDVAVGGNRVANLAIEAAPADRAGVQRSIESGRIPPAGSVRLDQMVNSFEYRAKDRGQAGPSGVEVEVARCPWDRDHRLVRIVLRGPAPAMNMVQQRQLGASVGPDSVVRLDWEAGGVASYRNLAGDPSASRDRRGAGRMTAAKGVGQGVSRASTMLFEVVPAPADPGLANDRPAEARRLILAIAIEGPPGANALAVATPTPVFDDAREVADASDDFRFAAAVAEYSMILNGVPRRGTASLAAARDLARSALGDDPRGERAKFVDLVNGTIEIQASRKQVK